PPQPTATPPAHRLADLFESDVDDALDIGVVEVLMGPRNLLNDLGFNHRPPPAAQAPAGPEVPPDERLRKSPRQTNPCINSSFRTLPNRHQAVKPQSAKRLIAAQQAPEVLRHAAAE